LYLGGQIGEEKSKKSEGASGVGEKPQTFRRVEGEKIKTGDLIGSWEKENVKKTSLYELTAFRRGKPRSLKQVRLERDVI